MDELFTAQRTGHTLVIDFTTESLMGAMELDRLGAALLRVAEEEKPPRILLNFARVRYLSSQAIGVVLMLQKAMKDQRGTLYLCAVNADLMKLLKITKLDKLLRIKATAAEAMAE